MLRVSWVHFAVEVWIRTESRCEGGIFVGLVCATVEVVSLVDRRRLEPVGGVCVFGVLV